MTRTSPFAGLSTSEREDLVGMLVAFRGSRVHEAFRAKVRYLASLALEQCANPTCSRRVWRQCQGEYLAYVRATGIFEELFREVSRERSEENAHA